MCNIAFFYKLSPLMQWPSLIIVQEKPLLRLSESVDVKIEELYKLHYSRQSVDQC